MLILLSSLSPFSSSRFARFLRYFIFAFERRCATPDIFAIIISPLRFSPPYFLMFYFRYTDAAALSLIDTHIRFDADRCHDAAER